MEAHRERLAHQPGPRVGDDVAGIGVDADQAGDLHGDAGLLGGLPDRRISRALARIDVPAGQFPVAGVTAAHQQHPAGDVADRSESARGDKGRRGGVWLMVILAADARPPGPRPAPAAGRGDRDRGPVLPGRGPRAWNRGGATPDRRCTDQDGRRTPPGPARWRISWHAFPSNERREARGVWTSYPACYGSGSKTSLPRRPGLNNQASPAAAGDTTDRSARLPCSVRLCRRLAFRRSSPPRTAAARGCTRDRPLHLRLPGPGSV